MKNKGILLLLLILLSNLCNAQIQQVQVPICDSIVSIAKFDTVIYLTTRNKVFTKNDHSTIWEQINNSRIKYFTSNSNKLFAIIPDRAQYCEVKYTTSTLSNFEDLSLGLFKFLPSSIVASDSIVYAGSAGEGLLYCNLSEKEWKPTPIVGCTVHKIVTNFNKVYALTSKGLFFSDADAQVWRKIIVGNAACVVNDFVVDSSKVYCTTNQGVFVYNAIAGTYANLTLNLVNTYCSKLMLTKNKLFISTKDNKLVYSNFPQINWQPVNDIRFCNSVNGFYNIDSVFFISTSLNVIYKSSDNGETWEIFTPSLKEVTIRGIGSIDSTLILANYATDEVWATNVNLDMWYKSYDIQQSVSQDYIKQIITIDSVLICLLDFGRMYKSFDKGKSWELINSPNNTNLVQSLFVEGNTLYIGCFDAVFKSSNYGVNWQRYTNQGNATYLFAKFGKIALCKMGSLHRTTDDGVSWNVSSLTGDYYNLNINRQYAFAVTSNGLHRSLTSEDSWVKLMDCPTITRVKIVDNFVFFNTTNSIYMSEDYGLNFKKIADLTLGNLDRIQDFTVAGGNVFIGCSKSFWKINLEGLVNVQYEQTISEVNSFDLLQNYPNPFNPSTTIKFEVPQQSSVKLIVYDILGKVVETLIDEEMTAGTHSINWNPNSHGKNLSSGIYFGKLNVNNQIKTIKMLYLK